MTEFQTHFDTPEAAYFGFFKADATQNPDAWAAVMCYPHTRVAASGSVVHFDSAEEYGVGATRDWTSRVKTGWVRTLGREPIRLHETSDRVHLVGGWTRLNANDEPTLWNRVTYILTKPDDSWGVQARFALGSYDGQDDEVATRSAAEAATSQVQRYYDALDKNDGNTCAGLCRFPMFEVGVGEVTRIENGTELIQRVIQGTSQIDNLNIGAIQSGADGVNVAVTATYASGLSEQSLLVVGRKADSWQIAGISRILTKP